MSVSSPVTNLQLNISIPTPPATVVRTPAGVGALQGVADSFTASGLYDGTFATVIVDGKRYVFAISEVAAV